MAESLLLPAVRGVVGKAADALVQSVTRMCGVDGDRRKLERQLLAIQCKLMDAEEKSETNPAVKRWMKDLRAVAYEADDVLDDFQYEALRREAKIGDSTTRKVLCYFTPQSPLLFRATMSRKLSNVLNKINELIEEMNKFGLMERTEPPQLPYRETHSALDDSADIMGRDDDKAAVVKLLMEQQDQHKLQVLPIVGMGGLGKTTLAKMVYNDYRIQNHFELKMWHCVSENFEVVSLLKSVIELATNERCELPDTIELLRGKLQAVIGKKRFMLVLDDVWNEEEKKWEDDLKPLLFSVGHYGSVILVTTRSKQVASIMETLGSYELACLNDNDSWELFSKIAYSRGVQEQAELVNIGRLIVKKCRGLPLALRTMGGLMSSKQLIMEWKTIVGSNIWESVKDVFPKDYEMDKEVLIQLWMANGFIQEDRTMDLEQKGEYVFHNLWRKDPRMVERPTNVAVLESSPHFQLSRINVGVEAEGHNIPLQIFPKLKYLELSHLSNLEKWAENIAGKANYFVTFPELEKLEITDCGKLASVPDCPVLKKLETQGCPSLAMSSLAHLTTLCELVYLAKDCMNMSLGSWPSLVRLRVSLSNDMITPLEINKNQGPLENLRSVELYGLSFFTATFTSSQMHARLWKCFTFVEELWIYGCNDLVRWPTEELMSLIHLRSLDIGSCDNLEGKGTSSEEIPKFPGSLEELTISYCPRLVALPSNLGNLAGLKRLSLGSCDGLKELPAGMDGLTSLEELTICSCPKIEKFPQGLLQRLATLKSLSIQSCPVLQRRCFLLNCTLNLQLQRKAVAATEPTASTASSNAIRKHFDRCYGSQLAKAVLQVVESNASDLLVYNEQQKSLDSSSVVSPIRKFEHQEQKNELKDEKVASGKQSEEQLPNRLGKMLAPLHWHDYKKHYGKLDDFVASLGC
ncbi:hypothetical protein ABZP36_028194 [Zizania latifolia]